MKGHMIIMWTKMKLIVRTLMKNANKQLYGFNLLDKWLKSVDKYADIIVNYPPINEVGLSLNSGEQSQ